ncbi:hypothetical protein ABPG77_005393 [Micractinium sp. CCAP 211/92]
MATSMSRAVFFQPLPGTCVLTPAAAGPPRRALAFQPAAERRAQRAGQRVVLASAGSGGASAAAPGAAHLQLATARLPSDVDREAFCSSMFQWASTLIQNGRNLPFALPLKCDKLPDGFQISLLRVGGGGAVLSVAELAATVEAVPGTGDVLMVRFYEGEGAAEVGMGGPRDAPKEQRLETLLASLVDVPVIMQTMPAAIKRAVMVSR